MRGKARVFVLAALVVTTVSAAMAQESARLDAAPPSANAAKLVAAPVAPVTVTPGKPSKVALNFRVRPGYHINSNQPKSDLLVATEVHFNPPTDIAVGKPTYPPGRDLTFAFAPEEKLNVYTGDFAVNAQVSAAAAAPVGTYRVHGELKYQACDDRACYPPAVVPVAFDVHVAKAAAKPRRNPAQSPHIHQ